MVHVVLLVHVKLQDTYWLCPIHRIMSMFSLLLSCCSCGFVMWVLFHVFALLPSGIWGPLIVPFVRFLIVHRVKSTVCSASQLAHFSGPCLHFVVAFEFDFA